MAIMAKSLAAVIAWFGNLSGRTLEGNYMKRIIIDFIPHYKQRYDTVGDYGETKDYIWFKITEFPFHPVRSIAILIHEIWEFFRNRQTGCPPEMVDKFDLAHPELDDPGLSKDAPYHKNHMEADVLERQCIIWSGDDWIDYEDAINKLEKPGGDNASPNPNT